MARESVVELRRFIGEHSSWSWRKIEGEFNLAMGERGPGSSTLQRIASKKTKPHPSSERFILKAISKIRAEAVKVISDELPSEIPDNVPEKKRPSFMNSLRKKFFKG